MQHSEAEEYVGRQSVESGSGFLSPGDLELSSRQPRNARRGFRPLSVLRSIMAAWRSEKSAARLGNGYFPVPNAVEAIGRETPLAAAAAKQPQKKRSRCSLALTCGLATLALLFGLSVGPYVDRHLRTSHDARSVDDIFGNWGKPGTGTEYIAWYPTDFMRDVIPVPCHSHNDYWRRVPFFSAIHAGCIGVEADVWLRNDDLLVGHDTAALQRNRTFKSLYVNPIVELLERSNPSTEFYHDRRRGVFDTDPEQTLILLVDLKTGGAETWPWVMKQLEPLRERGWLSYFQDGQVHKRQVTVVGTGNTPFDLIIANSTYRDAFFDAPLDKLENSTYDSTNSYYASVSFWSAIGNVWFRGEPSEGQLAKIRAQIREAHARGLHARYWELPPWPIHTRNRIWQILVEEGIDLLNVDDLDAATKGDWTRRSFFPRRRHFGRQ